MTSEFEYKGLPYDPSESLQAQSAMFSAGAPSLPEPFLPVPVGARVNFYERQIQDLVQTYKWSFPFNSADLHRKSNKEIRSIASYLGIQLSKPKGHGERRGKQKKKQELESEIKNRLGAEGTLTPQRPSSSSVAPNAPKRQPQSSAGAPLIVPLPYMK